MPVPMADSNQASRDTQLQIPSSDTSGGPLIKNVKRQEDKVTI